MAVVFTKLSWFGSTTRRAERREYRPAMYQGISAEKVGVTRGSRSCIRTRTAGNRWVAQGWDPTHNRRANSDYLVVAVGRDYADVAPLSGTYDGTGATNTLAVEKRLELT